mgnify:CR=1 FL=1
MKKIITFSFLFFVFAVRSQVVYTDIDPDLELQSSSSDSYTVDFNNDLNIDVIIFETELDTNISGFPVSFIGAALSTIGSNEVAGNVMTLGTENILLADTITSGNLIDSTLSYINTSSITSVFLGAALRVLSSGTFAATIGDYQPGSDGYIGVKFDIGGNIHYGWIRVNPTTDGTSCMVLDYAYESTPNTGIIAGDYGGSGLVGVQKTSADFQIRTLNKSIQVISSCEFNNAELNITSILGKHILWKELNSNNEIVSIDGLSSGIYLVTIFSDERKLTRRVYVR